MNFKKNLIYGLGLSLLLLFISSAASYISISNLIQSTKLIKDSNETILKLNNVLALVKDAETGQRGYILTQDNRFLTPYNLAKQQIDNAIIELSSEISNTGTQRRNFDILKNSVENRLKTLDDNLEYQKKTNTITKEMLMNGKRYMDEIRKTLTIMQNEENKLLESRTNRLNSFASATPFIIIISSILAIGITLYFFRKVLQNFNEKSSFAEKLESKNHESENRLKSIEKVAGRISDGDYQIIWDEGTKKSLGAVAMALNKMASSLQTSFKLLEEKNWLSRSVSELNNLMIGDKKLENLASQILEYIISNTNSNFAAFYLTNEEGSLQLSATHALERSSLKPVLKSGESISGQAFKSNNLILINDIPDDEKTISFATGNIKPKNILAIPITRYNIPVGVMEIGSIHDYNNIQIDFLKSVAPNIGLALTATQNRIKMQELLEETQTQAEELMTQQTELENINSELEAQSQKLLASEEELRVQQEELLQSNQELEERTSLLEEKNALIEQRNFDIQQKSIELEQSTKYKSEFLANMSHELRTPLNSILLLSKLMSESDNLDEEYIEYSQVIQSSGQGLLALIDEILDLSKIEAGKMTLEFADVAINDVAKDMRMMFDPIAKNKGIELKIHNNTDSHNLLHTDKLRLEQILKNLLSNAIKFTSQGSVTLDIINIPQSHKIAFKVIDTGIGISKDKLKIVFEAFQQADGSTQRKYGGTGLGLSISRELAKLLGGEIKVESTEGQGSEFTLIIPEKFSAEEDAPTNSEPLAEVQKPVQEAPKEVEEIVAPRFVASHIPEPIPDDRDEISEGDKVILIIEDDTAFAKILLDFARKKRYKGVVAVRGDVGVELAKQIRPLAILLDIQLPVMDGWQVMEALKSDNTTKAIPVHIMSSLKVKHESLLRGAVDFINKPFALEEMQGLFNTLEEAMNRSPKKVLIVEENEYHAQALSFFLKSHKISNNIAKNAKESIEQLQKNEVDCVILDMGVPDKQAYEILEAIKGNEGLEKLPIIVFTGKNLSKGEEFRLKKYADSIVVKTAHSYQRILDEAGLFLHLVEEKNQPKKEDVSTEYGGELKNILKDKVVLLTDDDVRNIFSLTKALELHGMKVITAMDGKEALSTLNKGTKVDIVLMDMMMPEMDGYESIHEIRKNINIRNLPIIAVTSKAMMGDREKCIAAGASDYISKPVDIDQLISLLRVWLYHSL